MSDPGERDGSWTLLTGHGRVLVEIARNPDARIRDLSAAAGITARTTQAIVADLAAAGYISRTRIGRRTRYTINRDRPFGPGAQNGLRIGPFLDLLTAMGETAPLSPFGDSGQPSQPPPTRHDPPPLLPQVPAVGRAPAQPRRPRRSG